MRYMYEFMDHSATNYIHINLKSLWFKEMFHIFVSLQSIPTAIQRFTATNHIGTFFVYIEEARSTFCASEAQN
jgi:hypothetical protein